MAAHQQNDQGPIRPTCDVCGSNEVVPVDHGNPSPEAFELALQQRVYLDGDYVAEKYPLWMCLDCYHEIGDSRDDRERSVQEQELGRLCATVLPEPDASHSVAAGRIDLRRMLRMFAGAGARAVELRLSALGNALRVLRESDWVTLPPPSDDYVRDMVAYLEDETRQIADDARGHVVKAQVGTREESFTVAIERLGGETQIVLALLA